MKEFISIATPDLVDLDFELAGPGSRFGALLIDLFLMTLSLIIVILLLIFTEVFTASSDVQKLSGSLAASLVFIVIFFVKWGYFIFFEIRMNGQTPGKRIMGIRVVQDNGLPIGTRQVVIRNLLRVADSLPPPGYFLGGLAIAISPTGKRLGDMAAGTIVVREDYALDQMKTSVKLGANWMARVERGESRHALSLPKGKISLRELTMMERYLERGHLVQGSRRLELATRLVNPLIPLLNLEDQAEEIRRSPTRCEEIIREVLAMSQASERAVVQNEARDKAGSEKAAFWKAFAGKITALLANGKAATKRLTAEEIGELYAGYQRLITDLARAVSLDADPVTRTRLNRIAVAGHNLLYGFYRPQGEKRKGSVGRALTAFARTVREHAWAMALSTGLFAAATLVSYFAVLFYPEFGYDLVSEGFLNFEPASDENLHDIPPLSRPVAASSIMTNNLQVTLLAFAFGLTCGLGTGFLLIFNGIHIGSVAAWMTLNGNARAFWGWVMPHGGTELLAIALAGGAGFMLARAILVPGRTSRSVAIRNIAIPALTVELGCMGMLVIAGLIEGFVSPAHIPYVARIVILSGSLLFWLLYFVFAGRGPTGPSHETG